MSQPGLSYSKRWIESAICKGEAMSKKKHGADVWERNEIESPCINICVVHPQSRLCTGCGRSIDEIRDWSAMDAEERRDIIALLPERVNAIPKRRGGRAARLKR